MAQGSIVWTTPLPTGFQLLPGDQIKIPLDSAVNMKSAIFSTATAATTALQISYKLAVLKTVPFAEANMVNCNLTLYYTTMMYFTVCQNRYLYQIEVVSGTYIKNRDPFYVTELNAVASGLPLTTQICSDITTFSNNKVYVLCYDSANPATEIFVFETPVIGNIYPTQARYSICPNAGWVKGDLRWASSSSNIYSEFVPIIYSITPSTTVPTTSVGTLNILYCRIVTSTVYGYTNTVAPKYNLATLNSDTTLSGNFLSMKLYGSNELVYFIAQEDVAGNKTLVVGQVSINYMGNGLTYLNYFINSYFDARHFTNHAQVGLFFWTQTNINKVTIVDNKTLYHHVLVAQKSLVPYFYSIGKTGNWSMMLDCGVSALTGSKTVYPSRIYGQGLSFDDVNARLVVEYRNMATYQLAEFAIVVSKTEYLCSRPPGFADAAIQSTILPPVLNGDTQLLSLKDSILTVYKFNTGVFLQFTAESAAGSYSVPVTASLAGWASSPTVNVAYDVYLTLADINVVSVPLKTVRLYPGRKDIIPVSTYSFQTTAGTYATSLASSASPGTAPPPVPGSRVLYLTVIDMPNVITQDTANPNITRILLYSNESMLIETERVPPKQYKFTSISYTTLGTTQFTSSNLEVTPTTTPPQSVFIGTVITPIRTIQVSKGVICDIFRANILVYSNYGAQFRCLTKPGKTVIANGAYLINTNQQLMDVVVHRHFGYNSKFVLWSISIDTSQPLISYFYLRNNIYHFYDNGAGGYNLGYACGASWTGSNLPAPLNVCYWFEMQYDYWGDVDYVNPMTFRMYCPLATKATYLARVLVDSNQWSCGPISYVGKMSIESRDIVHCPCRSEMVLYQWRQRKVWSQGWDRNLTQSNLNTYQFNIKDLNVTQIIQFVCLSQVSMFQLFVIMNDGTKKLINFRAGESYNASRRIHSIVSIPQATWFVDSTVSDLFIQTVCSIPGDYKVTRPSVYTYFDGPTIAVNHQQTSTNYSMNINAVGMKSTVSATVNVQFLPPPLSFNNIAPQKKWLNQVGTTFNLDNATDNTLGPVMDIICEGDAGAVTVTKRNQRVKSYNPASLSPIPNRVAYRRDFLLTVANGSFVQFSADPLVKIPGATAPKNLGTLYTGAGQARDGLLLSYGTGSDAVAITATFGTGTPSLEFKYNLHYLSMVNTTGTPIYSLTTSPNLFGTYIDMPKMEAVVLVNGDVVMALANLTKTVGNFVRLVCFRRSGTNFMLYGQAWLFSGISREISNITLTHDGGQNVVVIGNYKNSYGLITSHWTPVPGTTPLYFVESKTPFTFTALTEVRTPMVTLMQCWNKALNVLECFFDTEDANDSVWTVTLNSTIGQSDSILSITKAFDIELPPLLKVKKIERSRDYLAILTTKLDDFVPVYRRVLQTTTVDNYTQCVNMVFVYKPLVSKSIYTGISCSEFLSALNIDISMDSDGVYDYIAFSRGISFPGSTSFMDSIAINRISYPTLTITGSVVPKDYKMTFVGIYGSLAAENKYCLLDDLVSPFTPPPPTTMNWWPYILIAIGILLLLLLLVGLIVFLKKKAEAIKASKYHRSENEELDGKYGGGKSRGNKEFDYDAVDPKLIWM